MNRLVLLLATSSIGFSSFAQSNSVVFNRAQTSSNPLNVDTKGNTIIKKSTNNALSKTTGGPYMSWFDIYGQNFVTGTSAGYYYAVYPDSNVLDNPSSGSAYNIFTHGMGMSFDPTDDHYFAAAVTSPIADPAITKDTRYTLDSFGFIYQYIRNNPGATGTDSIIVELFRTPTTNTIDSGVYALRFNPNASFLPVTTDSAPRFATAIYTRSKNEVWDSIIADRRRFAFPLGWSDTAFSENAFAVNPPIVAPAGTRLVSYVHFKSAVNYPLNTNGRSANYLKLYAGEPMGATSWLTQPARNAGTGYPGSYQAGLSATDQIRYSDTGFNFTFTSGSTPAGHQILIPSIAYTNPPGFTGTRQFFHIVWSDATTNVDEVANNPVNSSMAYPVPANEELNIAFKAPMAISGVVTLTNTLGQVVATGNFSNVANGKVTFNTSSLSEGVYVYTINVDGVRTTGRAVVAH